MVAFAGLLALSDPCSRPIDALTFLTARDTWPCRPISASMRSARSSNSARLPPRRRAAPLCFQGLGGFLYLEVLDASFSFDGVIGAFALSNNMIVIAIGLSVGRDVRAFDDDPPRQAGTLAEYRLSRTRRPFWAIIVRGVIMLGWSATLSHPGNLHRD